MYLLLSPSLPVPLTLLFNSLLSILPLSSSSFSFRQFPLSGQSLLSPLLRSSFLPVGGPVPRLTTDLHEIQNDQQSTLEAEREGQGLWETEVEGYEEVDPGLLHFLVTTGLATR